MGQKPVCLSPVSPSPRAIAPFPAVRWPVVVVSWLLSTLATGAWASPSPQTASPPGPVVAQVSPIPADINFDDPALSRALQRELEEINSRSIGGFAAAMQGNLGQWQQLHQDLQAIGGQVAEAQQWIGAGALQSATPEQRQTLTLTLTEIATVIQGLGTDLTHLNQFFTDPTTLNNTLAQNPQMEIPDPDRLLDPTTAQTLTQHLITSVKTYNNVVLSASPETLTALHQNSAFVALGQSIRQVGSAFVALQTTATTDLNASIPITPSPTP